MSIGSNGANGSGDNVVADGKRIIGLLGRSGAGKGEVAGFIRERLRNTVLLSFSAPIKEFASFVFDFPSENLWGPSYKRNERFARFSNSVEWALARERLGRYAPGWTARVLLKFQGAPEQTVLLAKVEAWFNALQAESIGAPPESALTPRRVLQTLGTECGRAVDRDIWARYGLNRARAFLRDDVKAVVFDDARFLSEVIMLRKAGAEIWHIERPVFGDAGLSGTAAQHSSETEQESPEVLAQVTLTLRNAGTLDDLHAKVSTAVTQLYNIN